MSWFLLLKLVHIVAAIVAVGANLTYSFWIRRAGRDRDRLLWTMAGIRRLDSRVANPSYIVLLITGILMIIGGAFSFTTPWIVVAIVLYVLVALLGITVYAPALRTQITAAERNPGSAEYAAAARRSDLMGVVTTVLVLVIVSLMVLKPTLW